MASLALQRCLNHSEREAVARCPECSRFFCRECITEHDDRIVCAECIQRVSKPEGSAPRRRFRIASLLPIGNACVGLLVAWLFFYTLGRILLTVPTDSHAEKIWEEITSQPEDE